MSSWPLITQLLAAIATGALSALSFWVLSRVMRSVALAVLVALLPVVLPNVGQEVTTTIGSIYIPMLVTVAYLIAFPIRSRAGVIVTSILLALTILTIPTAVLLIIPVALALWSRSISRRIALLWSGVLGAGLLVQLIAVLSSQGQRQGAVSVGSTLAWVDGLTAQLLTALPFAQIPNATITVPLPISVARLSALLLLLALAVVAVILIRARTQLSSGVAGLLILGLLLSAAPVIAGVPNPRYYVLTVIILIGCALMGIDRAFRNATSGVAASVVCVIVAVLWVPQLPAAMWRATADPQWPSELDRVRAECVDENASPSLVFSPAWPEPGLRLTAPTTASIECTSAQALR